MTKFLPDGQAPKRRPKNIRGKVAAIAAFLLAGSGIAAPAQGGTQTFDIDLKDATLVELFRQIERQGECSFVYSIDDIRAVNRKDYRFSDATLAAVLDHAVAGTPLLYEIKDNHVIITKGAARQQRQSNRKSPRPPLRRFR